MDNNARRPLLVENRPQKYCKDIIDLRTLRKKENNSKIIKRYKRDFYNNVQVRYCQRFNVGCKIIYSEILTIANKWLQLNSNTYYSTNAMKMKLKYFIEELREWQDEKNSAIKFCVLCEDIKRANNRNSMYSNLMPKSYLNKAIPIPIPDDFDIENVIL